VTDGQLAVVGVGSVGSMALWQAAQRVSSVVGFDAASPAHPRSAVGGDTRLFRMTYRGEQSYYPLLQLAERQWRRLEEESGQQILTQCGGLSIGETDGSYIPALLDSIKRTGAPHEILDRGEMQRRYPQHRLGPTEIGIHDPRAGFVRTDRAVLAAVDVARQHGAAVEHNAQVREIHEEADHVVLATDRGSWTFDRVILASGSWSGALLPETLRARVSAYRIL
jgi:sarcosine oxidase